MLKRFILGACLATTLISSSSAGTLRMFGVGEWRAGSYSNDSTGEFTHCAATATYGSGISVLFAISKNANWWTVGFVSAAWKLSKGATYDIAFTVDDMSPISATAVALSQDHVAVRLQDSSELFARFRRGNVLSVAAADRVFRFNLTGTSQLLPILLRCAMNNGNPEIVANPFERSKPIVTKTKPAISSGSDRAAERAETTTLAANLLSQAGIQGFVLLDPNDLPSIKADAKWRAGDVFGMITIVPDIPAAQISDRAVQRSQRCEGVADKRRELEATFSAFPDESSLNLWGAT